jgi:AcrR family transcriptional regulator
MAASDPAASEPVASESAAGGKAPLPAGLDLLWGRRGAGKRGPRPGLSADAIVDAAIRLADAEGLEGVSMARVAAELGFTPMSLYRYVASKEELLQLMWNGSARGAEGLVLEGDGWRAKLRNWAIVQRDMLDRHPWLTQMPMAAPPMAPNSMVFVELGLGAMDGTALADADKLRAIGLISSYTLSEARMANDERRAEKEQGAPAWTYDALLRELADEATYPRLYKIAWTPPDSGDGPAGGGPDSGGPDSGGPAGPPSEREEFLFGIDRILDGIAAYMDRM